MTTIEETNTIQPMHPETMLDITDEWISTLPITDTPTDTWEPIMLVHPTDVADFAGFLRSMFLTQGVVAFSRSAKHPSFVLVWIRRGE